MGTGPTPHPDQPDLPIRTLGDLLSAETTTPLGSEKEWVALIESTAAGDLRALLRLYEEMHRIIFTLIVRITKNRDTAADLTLGVFHDLWRRALTYDARGGSVVAWLMNQARCRAIDRVRFDQPIEAMTDLDEQQQAQGLPQTVEEP